MNGYIRVQDLEVFISPGQKHGVLISCLGHYKNLHLRLCQIR